MKNPIVQLTKAIANIGNPRSTHWPTVRKKHLQSEGTCQYCGSLKDLEVHHVIPFHLHPELELLDTNLITLCESVGVQCHLEHGHLGSWRKINPNIRKDCWMNHK